MGRIQSSVGLVTGFKIQDTVDQLMQVNALPRNRLDARNKELLQQQVAISELTALVVGVELTTDRLGQASLFDATTVSSNKTELISATSSGTPKVGSYSFIPVQQAQSQQLTSSLFASGDQGLSEGELVIRTGGFLDKSVQLDQLNGGAGVARGSIRITDRAGSSQTIDLRFAQTAQDVVDAINANDTLKVVATLDGDRFVLTDQSLNVVSNLKVEEVSGGSTAADLGLSLISTSDNSANGTSVLNITEQTSLRSLRDGIGLDIANDEQLRIKLKNQSTIDIKIGLDSQSASVGQLLDKINKNANGKFVARIASDGKSLEIEDLTAGTGEFSVTSQAGTLATQLGLDSEPANGIVAGKRLVAGLGDVLLSSLRGGQGFAELGQITITNRAGAATLVDLSSAATLDEVIRAINSADAGVKAQLNRTKTGIEIADITGSTSQDLVIADSGSTNTATELGIARSVSSSRIDSGALGLQFVSRNTQLETFNGAGAIRGSIDITDTSGKSTRLNFNSVQPNTIGDVIDAINELDLGIKAQINENGDGLILIDTAGGEGELKVANVGSGNTATRLGIAGVGSSQTVAGSLVKAIDGSTNIRVDSDDGTTLAELVEKINSNSRSPVNASLLKLGNGGVRLLLNGKNTGSGARIAVESEIGISFTETAKAQDAVIAFGASNNSGGTLVSSSTNTFDGVVEDVRLTVNGTSTQATTVTVAESTDNLSKQIEAFVTQYNLLRDKLAASSQFDAEGNTVGVLFASSVSLRVEFAYSGFLSGRIRGASSITSLGELGINLDDKGKLSLNKQKLSEVIQRDPGSVKDFFTKADTGFSVQAKKVSERLAGISNGALLTRNNALQRQIEQNNSRIEAFDVRLERQRTRLLTQFYNMENAIGKLQSNQTALDQLQIIPPLGTTSK